MYVNLRRYPGVAASKGAVARSVEDDLLPELGARDGFEAYCAFRDEEGAGVSVTVFRDREAALGATDTARRYVLRHRDLFPERGEEFAGACIAHEGAPGPARGAAGAAGSGLPYALVRELADLPGTQDTVAFVQQRTMPMIARSPGFRAVYTARGDRDERRAAVVTLFDGEAEAVACHERAVALLREGLPRVRVTRVLKGWSTVFRVAG